MNLTVKVIVTRVSKALVTCISDVVNEEARYATISLFPFMHLILTIDR